MLKTWSNEKLGIRHSIIQGGIGPCSTNRIAAASERDTLVARGIFGPMRFITNAASIKLVESTAGLFPDFFKGQPVDLHPQLIEMEREDLAQLIENDEGGSLILSTEVSGRI